MQNGCQLNVETFFMFVGDAFEICYITKVYKTFIWMATYCIINDFNINFKNLKSKIILYKRSISFPNVMFH